jgi:hypothetical protein
VQIQEATVANPGEFDWKLVGNPIMLTPYQLAGSPGNSTFLSYTGNVTIPTPSVSGAKQQLLITEHEVFLTDATTAFPTPAPPAEANPIRNFPPNMTLNIPSSVHPLGTTSRIVFSDVLPLS